MWNSLVALFCIVGFLMAPPAARADVTYAPGTSIEQAWLAPPRISAAQAVVLLSSRLLARHVSGSEGELGSDVVEALKFLVGNHAQAVPEAPVQPGFRRYGGEITVESMTTEQRDFFGTLSLALVRGLGTTSLDASDLCVTERSLFEVVKYKYDLG